MNTTDDRWCRPVSAGARDNLLTVSAARWRSRVRDSAAIETARRALGERLVSRLPPRCQGERIVGEAGNLHSGNVFADVAALAAAIEPYRARAAASFVQQARELLAARAAAVSVAGG